MSRFNSAASTVSELRVRLTTFFNKGVGTDNLTNDSVTVDIINSNVAGSGLSQDTDGSLKVNVDNSTIEISSDTLQIKNSGIIEVGSNSNGNYRKWSDGTLECWGKKDLGTINIDSNYGGYGVVYVSSSYTVTWPVTFASINHSNVTVRGNTTTYGYFTNLVPPTVASQTFSLSRFSPLTSQSIAVGFYAIGRWE